MNPITEDEFNKPDEEVNPAEWCWFEEDVEEADWLWELFEELDLPFEFPEYKPRLFWGLNYKT